MHFPRITAKTILLIPALLFNIVPRSFTATRAKSPTARWQADVTAASELTSLLRQFLDDAGRGNRAGFERFFADDVIYTRSSGLVINKGDILRAIENGEATEDPQANYSAEDIVVHEYGDTAVLAFRLVARTNGKDGKVETTNYRNTGTFLRRNGVWRAVAWQSTKVPEPSETFKKPR